MALTEKQRHSIIERDWGTSQLLHYNEKEGWYKGGYCQERGGDCTDLHVHHIDPQRNGGGDEPTQLTTKSKTKSDGRSVAASCISLYGDL